MTSEEAVDVVVTIGELYPQFNVTEKKLRIMIPILMKMDYEQVKKNLINYCLSNPFPPTISDIAAFPPQKNSSLDKIKTWHQASEKVPPEKLIEFRKQIKKLIAEKGKNGS